ncbi:hypothetical protein ACIGXQ_09265 [Streptomyces anulatus]
MPAMIGFMGTDIHGFIEVRNSYIDSSEPDDDELFFRWHPAMALNHVYNSRSYDAFGCLFGVRGRLSNRSRHSVASRETPHAL